MKTVKQYIMFALVVLSSTVVLAGNPPGHWSFPGPSIADHLSKNHNMSVKGLSEEQMLKIHDKIHIEELRMGNVQKAKPTTVTQPVRIFRWFRR